MAIVRSSMLSIRLRLGLSANGNDAASARYALPTLLGPLLLAIVLVPKLPGRLRKPPSQRHQAF
jgi:hypothetical protein